MIVIPEILEIIFSYLYYPVFYPKFLLSCALVSRSWSYNALPFLWSKPFIYDDVHNKEKLHIKQVQQFRIFFSFLPNQFLNQLGLKSINNNNNNQKRNINYNYLSFIKEFHYLKLYEACLEFWKVEINNNEIDEIDYKIFEEIPENFTLCTLCTTNNNSNPNHPSKYFIKSKILPIIIELFNLIIYNSNIKYFDFSIPKKKCFCDYIPLNYFTITSSPSSPSSSNLSFSNLQSFKCNGRYNFPYKKLFIELIKSCKNILEIKLENFELIDDNLDCLKKLLVSQRKLRNLELNFLIKQDFSDLFLSLKGHSNLNYVKISYCLFNKILPIKILSSCNNLEELIIESSEIEENDSIEDTVDSVDSYESIDSIGSNIININNNYNNDNNYNININNININSINSIDLIDYYINPIGSINSIGTNSIHSFTKLKSLKIIKSILPKNIFNQIFSNESNLEKIIIKDMDLLINYSNIIPLIYLNCNQLKFLEISLSEYTFEKILKILENCNKLKELIIYDENNNNNHDYYNVISIDHLTIGQVFKRMGNLISNNLKKLFITSYYYFTEDEFKDFLFNYYNNHNNNGNLKQLSINICGDKLNTLNLLKDYSNEINKNLIIKQWDTKNYDGKKNNQLQHQKLTTPKLNNRYNIKSDNNNIKINVPHPFVSIRIAISHALCVGLIRIIRTPSSLFTIKINLYSKSNTVILSTSDSIIFPFVFTLLSFYPPNVHDDLMLTNVDCRFFLE
ncbi:uncharacterized protein OCT59_008864 [Rhizophagus irregularis]|nr:hypothetical protein OCT59_008864 [Rhizophagus irregularis]